MSVAIWREMVWLTTGALAVLMVVAWQVGWWWGRWQMAREERPEAGKIADASLALMGLLLAFTFSMALDKHGRRREMVVQDANAIGDFYTSVSLLAEPQRSQLRQLLRRYTEHRLEIARRQPRDVDLFEAVAKIDAMHEQMGELTRTAVEHGTPVTVPLVNTLNGVTSNAAARLWAATDFLPLPIVMLLGASVLMSISLVGRGQALDGKPQPGPTLGLIVMIALVLYITLDLNQPGRGLIRVGQEPMERLLKTMSP